MAPQLIAFDLGKVLLDFDYGIAAARLAAYCALPAEAIRRSVNQSDLLHRYERGQLDTAAFVSEFTRQCRYRGSVAEFRRMFGDIFTQIEPMVRLHATLRQRGFQTWIFSNTNEIAVEHIRAAFPFFRTFDGYVFSYAVGCMKPEPGMYQALERGSGRAGAEIFYLDDRPENVAAGADRGWQTLVHQTPAKSIGRILALIDRRGVEGG